MRCTRLVLEAGTADVTVRFHPDLTVVTGVSQAERDGLVAEVLGALGGGRSGAHAEVLDATGRRLAVIRPALGRDRVIDLDAKRDVTRRYRHTDGTVDLLRSAGLTREEAHHRLRLRADDLQVERRGDALVARLAAAPQRVLWRVADEVRDAERWVAAEAARRTPGDDGRLADAVVVRTRALTAWQRLAGAIDPETALRLKGRVAAAVGGMPDDPDEPRATGGGGATEGGGAAALARALTSRLARAARAGSEGDPLPLLLDEPFAGLPEPVVRELLGLVLCAVGTQVVLLTADPVVERWAGAHAGGDRLSVLSPHLDPSSAPFAPVDVGVTAPVAPAAR